MRVPGPVSRGTSLGPKSPRFGDRFKPGSWVDSPIPGLLTTGAPPGQQWRAIPFPVFTEVDDRTGRQSRGSGIRFTAIAVEVTTAVAATTIRLGIATNREELCYPDAVILEGTVSSATIGFKQIAIEIVLRPALYWLLYRAEGGAPTCRGFTASQTPYVYGIGENSADVDTAYAIASTGTGPWPQHYPDPINLSPVADTPRIPLLVA